MCHAALDALLVAVGQVNDATGSAVIDDGNRGVSLSEQAIAPAEVVEASHHATSLSLTRTEMVDLHALQFHRSRSQ
jgi:hypothetical protein